MHASFSACFNPRKRGYGVAVTDHNEVKGAEKAWRMRKDVFVIPGIEASTKRGVHSLYYFSSIRDCKAFFNKVVKPLRKKNPFFLPIAVEELVEKAHDYNAYVSAAHPYGPGVIGIKKVKVKKMKHFVRHFDFIEGLNAALRRNMNEKAIKWGKFIDKPMTAGSDGHTTPELGNSLTMAYGDDIDSYFSSIRKGHNTLFGKEENLVMDAIHAIRKETKYIKKAEEMGKGKLWIKEHGREFKALQKMVKSFKKGPDPYHLMHLGKKEKHMKNRKEYLKLGKGMFK